MCQATLGGNSALANSTTGGSQVASKPATVEFHQSTNRSRDLRLGPRPPGPHFLLPRLGEGCGCGYLFSSHAPYCPGLGASLHCRLEQKCWCSCRERLCVCSANQFPATPASTAFPLLSLLNSQRHLVCEFVCQGSQLFHTGVDDLLTTASVRKGGPH